MWTSAYITSSAATLGTSHTNIGLNNPRNKLSARLRMSKTPHTCYRATTTWNTTALFYNFCTHNFHMIEQICATNIYTAALRNVIYYSYTEDCSRFGLLMSTLSDTSCAKLTILATFTACRNGCKFPSISNCSLDITHLSILPKLRHEN